nr:MAG TPA: hypothetical protein [Caudoviricetes sp.]
MVYWAINLRTSFYALHHDNLYAQIFILISLSASKESGTSKVLYFRTSH